MFYKYIDNFFRGILCRHKGFFKITHILTVHNVKFKFKFTPSFHINVFAFIFVSLVCPFQYIRPDQTRLEGCSDWKAV